MNNDLNEKRVKGLADSIGMKLSDSELENVTNELKNMEKTEDQKIMENAKIESDKEQTNSSEEVFVETDPVTGETSILEDPFANKTIDEIVDEELKNGTVEATPSPIAEIPANKLVELGLSEEDGLKLMDVINRLQSGEKFSVYNSIPENLRLKLNTLARTMGCKDQNTIRSFAKEFILELGKELSMDKEFIDLQKSIKDALDFNVLDMWSDHLREKIEVDLTKQAEILDKDYPEKAKMLRDIVDSFKDSYTYRRQYELLESSEKVRNRLTKDLKRFKRECEYFNFKYERSKFSISNIMNIKHVLLRKMPEYTEEDIAKFIMLLCKVSQDLHADNLVDHAFMYYSVSNIIALDNIDFDSVNLSEFNKTVINNVKGLLNKIKEIEDRRNKENN